MIVILLGPPGSGKGTQAELIRKNLGFCEVSMGDMIRESVNRGDEIGRKTKSYFLKGELVPDNIILEIVKKELDSNTDKKNFIFDGFPRNINQAISFVNILNSRGKGIDVVFYFDVPFPVLRKRLSRRYICPNCGAIYALGTSTLKLHNTCDVCNTTLLKRDDDSEEIVKNRFQVYKGETFPVKQFYKKMGLLINIKNDRGKKEIWMEIKEYLNKMLLKEAPDIKGG